MTPKTNHRPHAGLFLFVLVMLLCGGCDRAAATGKSKSETQSVNAINDSTVAEARDALFNEVTAAVGFNDRPPIYPDGTYRTPEITPGGVALFDADNDGLLDILLIRHPAPGPDQMHVSAANQLFHQNPDGTFHEVPNAGGLGGSGFHNGVAIGDIDNDSFLEVFVANYGSPDQLFHNNADGTFTDITARAGLPTSPDPANWTSTATFVDYDGDGYLDLIVVHFATFTDHPCVSPEDPAVCDYCGPHTYAAKLVTVYHNNRNGTFTDATRSLGINIAARGWGIIAGDLHGTGHAEIFQANDEEANQLWVRQDDGTFADEAVLRGCAFNVAGAVQANMGVAIGDTTHSGNLDLFLTHISGETNIFLKDNGDGSYTDATASAGMGPVDRPFTGWGCGFFDFDNDGNLDLAVANGRVNRGPTTYETAVGKFWRPFAEPNLLFKGDGAGHFVDVSEHAGLFAQRREVHRALAFGDLQNRGAIDMVVTSLDNSIRVFRNNAAHPGSAGHHWLQVLPMIGKREALGARLVLRAGGRVQAALCLRGYSYVSSSDPRVHFGLGDYSTPRAGDAIQIDWPSGTPRHESFPIVAVDRALVLKQGAGQAR